MGTKEQGEGTAVRIGPRGVMWLAAATLLGFGGTGAWLIAHVQERPLTAVVLGTASWWEHLIMGAVPGLLISAGAWAIITRPWLAPVRRKYAALIGPLMPTLTAQVLVSVCAGVGEELFFRGALQHWAGIPWTALLFVALHGYLDPRDARISLYGLFLTAAMMGLGLLAERTGLLAPIIAHTVIDIVLINRLAADWRRNEGRG